jgi:hypothetical protein
MKKSQLIITFVLIASIVATFAVYELYVKVRYTELKDHQTEEESLRRKITDLNNTFSGTKPEIVLELYQSKKQPWYNSIKQRTEYFQLREIEAIEVPDEPGIIPRIWYGKEFPKLKTRLEEMALQSGTILNPAAVQFNINEPDKYGPGTNPKRGEISNNMNLYQYGMEMTKLLIDHKATEIKNIVMWTPRDHSKGRLGVIKKSTTGYDFEISWQNLSRLLESLRINSKHYTIETFKIEQPQMRNIDAPVKVSMVVTQAWYSETVTTAADGESIDGKPNERASEMLNSLFGETGLGLGGGKVITAPGAESESFLKRLWFKLMPF